MKGSSKARDVVRSILALIFLLGAIANSYMGLFTPAVYETFADGAILPLYANLWHSLVYPHIRLFLVPLVVVELSIGWLLLRSGISARVGLGVALAFTLFLIPFWWEGGAIANLVLAVPLLWLLRYDHPRPILRV